MSQDKRAKLLKEINDIVQEQGHINKLLPANRYK